MPWRVFYWVIEMAMNKEEKAYQKAYRVKNKEKIAAKNRRYYEANKERLVPKMKEHYKVNRDTLITYQQEYRKNNPEKVSEALTKWRQNNKDKVNAYIVNRKVSKLQRTPSWLTKEDLGAIRFFYYVASLATDFSDTQYHVDHDYPLQGELVSGLHTPGNLKVMTAKANLSKSNGFKPSD